MEERPTERASPESADDDHDADEQHTQTLTDLLDELDRASFRRALACRDGSYDTTTTGWRGRK